MSVPPVHVIRRGPEKARAAPWRGDGAVALITPPPEAPLLSVDFVHHCMTTLGGQGFRRVVTGALSPLEQSGFLAAGFAVAEPLLLLTRDLSEPLPRISGGPRPRRVPRRLWSAALAVDAAAFPEFWRFDDLALADALSATPRVRFRAARRGLGPGSGSGGVAAYAICGRAGHRGYVQRLAVRPEMQGRGTGRRLLVDGLRWMAAHGVTRAWVNTQPTNHAALALYRAAGFREEPIGLSVLEVSLQ